jgi:hypothetical protein
MNQKGFTNIVLIILAVVLVGTFGYISLVKKSSSVEPQLIPQTTPLPAVSNNPTPQNPSPSKISNLKTYKNDTYGFQFQYPDGVIIENGVKEFFFFGFKKPIITVKDSARNVLFAVGTTDYFKFDPVKQKYVLQAPNDIITFQENCTEPFFGNNSVRAAKMVWGDGGEWTVLYNIFTNHNVGLGITMNRFDPDIMAPPDRPDIVEQLKQSLKTRIALEEQILKTFVFVGDTSSIDFTCKNWSR